MGIQNLQACWEQEGQRRWGKEKREGGRVSSKRGVEMEKEKVNIKDKEKRRGEKESVNPADSPLQPSRHP